MLTRPSKRCYRPLFERERDAYLRLRERDPGRILGFDVPKLISFDNDLWIVEMTIVAPPCVLDFAGAYLDEDPLAKYSPEEIDDWMAEKVEQFGENWPIARKIMLEFRKLGIYLSDVNNGNLIVANA